jgi:hypothetical protein
MASCRLSAAILAAVLPPWGVPRAVLPLRSTPFLPQLGIPPVSPRRPARRSRAGSTKRRPAPLPVSAIGVDARANGISAPAPSCNPLQVDDVMYGKKRRAQQRPSLARGCVARSGPCGPARATTATVTPRLRVMPAAGSVALAWGIQAPSCGRPSGAASSPLTPRDAGGGFAAREDKRRVAALPIRGWSPFPVPPLGGSGELKEKG